MYSKLITILFLSLYTYLNISFAFVTTTDADQYYKYNDPVTNYDFIFSKDHEHLIPTVHFYNNLITAQYQKEFNWTLDNKTSLILASNKNQIDNAFATVIPFSMTLFYGGGANTVDWFSEKSWIMALLTHETAHLYQLSPKQGLAKLGYPLFGNNAFVMPFFPIYWITFPNMFTPNFIIEGNAVLNECRFGNGGRLYSGEQRAQFFALLKSNLLNPSRVLNQTLNFPGPSEKYIIGAYFNLFLAETFGIEKTNSLFYTQGNRYLNPFRINQTFLEHFNESYYTLLMQFLKKYEDQASNQVQSTNNFLLKSFSIPYINKLDDRLLILSSEDQKSYPKLYQVSTNDGEILEKRSVYFDSGLGKPFLINNTLYIANNQELSNGDQMFSLWDEDGKYLEYFNNKIILDIKKNNTLYFDAKNSFLYPQLKVNEKLIGEVHSTAIFDKDGNIFYFKQQDNKRLLYKNDKIIFEITGYYSKIVDIDDDIYLILATKYGSSLFSITKDGLIRLFSYDTIIDAKKIKNNLFALTMVTDSGYVVSIEKQNIYSKELPATYNYFFETKEEFNLLSKIEKKSDNSLLNKKKNYFHPTELRFSSFDMSFESEGQKQEYKALWVDPLIQNAFEITHTHRNQVDDIAGKRENVISYQNMRFPIYWAIILENVLYDKTPAGYTKIDDELISYFYLSYDYKKIYRWPVNIYVGTGKDFYKNQGPIYFAGSSISYGKHFPLSMYPHKLFRLSTSYNKEVDTNYKEYQIYSNFYKELQTDINLFGDCHYFSSSDPDTIFGGDETTVMSKDIRLLNNTNHNSEVLRLGLGIRKVLPLSYYPHIVPIALQRISPSVFASRYDVTSTKNIKYNEWGFAIDSQLLVAHEYSMLLTIYRQIKRDDKVVGFNFTSKKF